MGTRTNIVLDDVLIAKAMARAGVTTKKAAVEAALRAFVRKPDYSGLLALAGSGVIADDYDPKALFPDSPQLVPPHPASGGRSRPASKAKSAAAKHTAKPSGRGRRSA